MQITEEIRLAFYSKADVQQTGTILHLDEAIAAAISAYLNAIGTEAVAWQWRAKASGASEWGEWRNGRSPALIRDGYETEERPLFTSPLPVGEEVERLTRPIVGMDNRPPQEVFDIMADRIRHALSITPEKGGEK